MHYVKNVIIVQFNARYFKIEPLQKAFVTRKNKIRDAVQTLLIRVK